MREVSETSSTFRQFSAEENQYAQATVNMHVLAEKKDLNGQQ